MIHANTIRIMKRRFYAIVVFLKQEWFSSLWTTVETSVKWKKLMILIIKLSVILFKSKYNVRMNTAIERVGEYHFRIRVWSLFSTGIKIFICSLFFFFLTYFIWVQDRDWNWVGNHSDDLIDKDKKDSRIVKSLRFIEFINISDISQNPITFNIVLRFL